MEYENEITVKVSCSYEELNKMFLDRGFEIVDDLRLIDTYFFKNDIDVKSASNKDILNNYLIIREPSNDQTKITYKYKELYNDGSVKKQRKLDCPVYSKEQASELLKCLGYNQSFVIVNDIKKYRCNNICFWASLVNDDYLCLEYSGIDGQTVEEVIRDFKTYNIPHDDSNYFINKAIIELNKICLK